MTLYQFNALDCGDDKLAVITVEGVVISSRNENGREYLLYQLPDFYVEMSGDEVEFGQLKFRAFISLAPLEPYLVKIDISGLMGT